MKVLLFLSVLIFSVYTFGAALFNYPKKITTKKIPTPQAVVKKPEPKLTEYDHIYASLESFKNRFSLSCDQNLSTVGHALICNCANEAGLKNVEGMTAVSQVVFSRLKSPDYPSSVLGVICEDRQFSWTIGGWSRDCKRKSKKKPTFFNSPIVKGEMLTKCISSAQIAARRELVENPTQLFALNYCSTNPRAYKNDIPRWCSNLISSSRVRLGGHAYGFANRRQNRTVPQRTPPPAGISFFKYLKKIKFFINSAHASTLGELKIVNTRSTQKVEYNNAIKKIMKKKYKNFKPYAFKEYSKPIQDLMKETRNNLPAAAIGDYNGDGEKDLILMGSQKTKSLTIAFLSKGRGFKDYLVTSESVYKKPLNTYLVNIQKSKVIFKDNKTRDAFQIESFGGAAVSMFFNGRKFIDNYSAHGFDFK